MAKKQKGDYRAGEGTGPQVAAALTKSTNKKQSRQDIRDRIDAKQWHRDWYENNFHWRWLLDSYEGGNRYRNAVYGMDRKGMPARNLKRHRREYPDPQQFPAAQQSFGASAGLIDANSQMQSLGVGPFPGMLGADPHSTAQDDDYEFRRACTEVPEFVAEAAEIHLSKIYKQEIDRDGPDILKEWWKDVDGRGTPIDDYMRETVAPLLLTLGNLDMCFDHPEAPEGAKIVTRKDEIDAGLDNCVTSYILPENVVWWRIDSAGRYLEAVVQEYIDPSDRNDFDSKGKPINPDGKDMASKNWINSYVRYRHWTATESTLYNYEGNDVIETIKHKFGCVPIYRHIAEKNFRSPHVGKSFYESIADLQRKFYNKLSEQTVSDEVQAHAILTMPEDFCTADKTITVGPYNVIPQKKCESESRVTYAPPSYIAPPPNPAESLRKNLSDMRDRVDRRAALTKPAGVQGTTGGSVGQSGISKQLDAVSGNDLLSKIAKILAKAEKAIAEFALMVLMGEKPKKEELDKIVIRYPVTFELYGADEILASAVQFQMVLASSGHSPQVEFEIMAAAIRKMLPGMSDEAYKTMDAELQEGLAERSDLGVKEKELGVADVESNIDALETSGNDDGGERDPTGVSAGTQVSGMTGSGL